MGVRAEQAAKMGQGGPDVVLLTPALVPGTAGAPTPRKLKRRVARCPCAHARAAVITTGLSMSPPYCG